MDAEQRRVSPFQKLFTDEDELVLLGRLINFHSEKGNPFTDLNVFCEDVKNSISFKASNKQLISKIRSLNQKFTKTVEKSLEKGKGGEDEIVFAKDSDREVFELWRKIWGNDGFMAKKKLVEDTELTPAREIISFLMAENTRLVGLDEAKTVKVWNSIADGRKKRALEKRFREIRAIETELCLEKTAFVDYSAKMLLRKDDKSSCDIEMGYVLSQRDCGIKKCKAAEEEEEKNDGEQLESDDGKTEHVSAILGKETEAHEGVTVDEISSGGMEKGRKKLVVLDLNGLLADIVSPSKYYNNADITIGRRAIFKRPFYEDFLNFCFDKFEVGIWSSRKQSNLERIVEFLLGDLKSKLLFCWDMSHCVTTSLPSPENMYKQVVFKNLKTLWRTLASQKKDFNETNTILLDDTPYKALLNPPFTAIFPHTYNYQNKTDTSLGSGGDLRLYLEKLVEAENVQDFIKSNPFGKEAITEASDCWEYYRHAVGDHNSAFANLAC